MIRRMLFGALVTSCVAFAAPPAATASKASPKDLNTCMKALEDRSGCKEDICDMQIGVMAKQMAGRVPQDRIEAMKSRMKTGCVSHMEQEGKDAAERRGTCERMAAVGSLPVMLEAHKACSAKKSCKERASCEQPFLQKEAERQNAMHSGAMGGHPGMMGGHPGMMGHPGSTAYPPQQGSTAYPPQQGQHAQGQ